MKTMRWLFTLLVVAALAVPVWAQEAEAVPLAAADENGAAQTVLTDGQRGTRLKAENGATLTLHAGQPVQTLYLLFDRPTEWTLCLPDKTCRLQGQNGFLHEVVRLEQPVTEFEIALQPGARLCEVYAFAAGELPGWVQQWQPPCEKADLLLMPTHADDEHLWFGGAMPYYAGQLGLDVQVVYMANHWGEAYRPHELLDGLWTVGVTHYPVMGKFNDHYADTLEQALNVYDREEVLEWQTGQLRRFKPLVVLGHDLNGEYGHGAHRLNAETLREAAALAADPERFAESAEKYGVWDTPKLYLHLYKENEIVMDWQNMPLPAFGGKTAFEVAEAGFACHASQQGVFHVVGAGGWYDCRRFGLVRSTVGEDVKKDDLFENIALPRPAPTPEPTPTPVPTPEFTPSPQPVPQATPTQGAEKSLDLGPAEWLLFFAGGCLGGAVLGLSYKLAVYLVRKIWSLIRHAKRTGGKP